MLENRKLISWINEIKEWCMPDSVHICDGSDEEYDQLAAELVKKGTFISLNEKLRPHSFLARSTPDDVARVEDRMEIK